MINNIRPYINNRGIGWCRKDCPQYSNKYCKLMFTKAPKGICEPYIETLATRLQDLLIEVERLHTENIELQQQLKS